MGWANNSDLGKVSYPVDGAPLPPTAEETSVGRFNALANEIRDFRKEMADAGLRLNAFAQEIIEDNKALGKGIKDSHTATEILWSLDSKFIESVKDCLAVFSHQLDGVNQRAAEHTAALSAICDSQTDLHKELAALLEAIQSAPLRPPQRRQHNGYRPKKSRRVKR